jgi:hypothetical protein
LTEQGANAVPVTSSCSVNVPATSAQSEFSGMMVPPHPTHRVGENLSSVMGAVYAFAENKFVVVAFFVERLRHRFVRLRPGTELVHEVVGAVLLKDAGFVSAAKQATLKNIKQKATLVFMDDHYRNEKRNTTSIRDALPDSERNSRCWRRWELKPPNPC